MVLKLEHICELHKMCVQQLHSMRDNIEEFCHVSERTMLYFKDNFEDENTEALMLYDNFMTSLTNVMDLSRKFCIHLSFYMQSGDLCLKTALREQNGITNSSTYSNTKHNTKLDPITTNKQETAEFFDDYSSLVSSFLKVENYPRCTEKEEIREKVLFGSSSFLSKNLSAYQPGTLLTAWVTFIQNPDCLEFFVCDLGSEDTHKVLLSYGDVLTCRQYTALPPEQVIFGLVLDNVVLRAVRQNISAAQKNSALLLDFGEVVQVDNTHIMYQLPQDMQQQPAQAIPCKLVGVSGSDEVSADDLKQCLQEQLYEKCTFRVVSCNRDLLNVQLQVEQNLLTETIVEQHKNPFLDYLDEAIPLPTLPRETIFCEEKPDDDINDEMKVLYEETPTTSDAMTAVMGYYPKDDERICRFYDPKTRSCFKGAKCRQEHTLRQAEGWTKDVIPATTVIDTRIPTVHYENGTIINITPTYVGQLERFYAQINEAENLTPFIWSDEDLPNLNLMKKLPYLFDIVLAKYEDGLWYRAKVLETHEDSKMVKVFYVDYGNHQTVHLRDLAYCDNAVVKEPFQALLFRLAGVCDIKGDQSRYQLGLDVLRRAILNKSLDVEVICHQEDLLIRFTDADYNEISKILVDLGCMQPFKTAKHK